VADSKLSAQQQNDDQLDAEDVIGKRFVTTRLRSSVTIREENAIAALEVMSRYAINPKWLIYLPPTMSPTETSRNERYLEYPEEGFNYYRTSGIPRVVCQEKHMGSRAVVVVCRNEEAAARCFGVEDEGIGVVYTRTGRSFFNDSGLQNEFVNRVAEALGASGFWEELSTEWVCLDCELMPWSEKAQELLRSQYSAVGAAGSASLEAAVDALQRTAARRDLETGFEIPPESGSTEFDLTRQLATMENRKNSLDRYIEAYQQYCWPVTSLTDFKLAPFHVLATNGSVHADRDHGWHMTTIAKCCAEDRQLLLPTPYRIVDLTDEESIRSGCEWWESLTARGGEGMVIKPFDFVTKGKRGLVQPAVKCRGREYLRIIYGPEYTAGHNLERLRSRALGTKRSLALREFALGIEALERFVRKEPLRRIHECVFGVLALESEPVDPRL